MPLVYKQLWGVDDLASRASWWAHSSGPGLGSEHAQAHPQQGGRALALGYGNTPF